MEFFKLEVSENSKIVFSCVQGTRLNAINELMYFVRSNGVSPEPNNHFFIKIERVYFDQYGKRQLKYKKGKFCRGSFSIHFDQYNEATLESELINRFFKNK